MRQSCARVATASNSTAVAGVTHDGASASVVCLRAISANKSFDLRSTTIPFACAVTIASCFGNATVRTQAPSVGNALNCAMAKLEKGQRARFHAECVVSFGDCIMPPKRGGRGGGLGSALLKQQKRDRNAKKYQSAGYGCFSNWATSLCLCLGVAVWCRTFFARVLEMP
jgi:hypothetical protein